jgi:hypothetical protein
MRKIRVKLTEESSVSAESYHKTIISELKLDNNHLIKFTPDSSPKKVKTTSGLLRYLSVYTDCTRKNKKKLDCGYTKVLKALKSSGYVAGPLTHPSKDIPEVKSISRIVYKNGTNSVVVINTDYKEVSYIEFHLFTPGSSKDLPK